MLKIKGELRSSVPTWAGVGTGVVDGSGIGDGFEYLEFNTLALEISTLNLSCDHILIWKSPIALLRSSPLKSDRGIFTVCVPFKPFWP